MSDEPIPGQATCEQCSAPLFWVGNGRRPTLCDECSPNPPRRKKNQELVPLMAERSKQATQKQSRSVGAKQIKALIPHYAITRMAIGLGIAGDDLRTAAAAGGVRIDGRLPTDAEIEELARRAREEAYAPFREGREVAAAQLTSQAQMLLAVSVCELAPGISAGAAPLALNMVNKTLQNMGGGKVAWPQVNVTFEIEEVS